MPADRCCFVLCHRWLCASAVLVIVGYLHLFTSTCTGYALVVPAAPAVTTRSRAINPIWDETRRCASWSGPSDAAFLEKKEAQCSPLHSSRRTLLQAHRNDSPPAGDAPTTSDDDRSAFFRNIKSKLSFPLETFERRLWRRPTTPRERLTNALRTISRWVLFPYRWLRRHRPRQKAVEAENKALPPTAVRQSTLVKDVVETTEAVASEEDTVIATSGVSTTTLVTQESSRTAGQRSKIEGDRWAVASVDLSGQWEILVTDEFKQQYDTYLTLLGQPLLVRSVALSIVGLTTEETIQTDDGRDLFIRGRNVRGCWERSLISSGADEQSSSYEPTFLPIVTADAETVYSEAWWERNGTVHRSWLRGVQKYGGGDFESLRYLDGDVLVCQSTFHPKDTTREKASVTWRFKRQHSLL